MINSALRMILIADASAKRRGFGRMEIEGFRIALSTNVESLVLALDTVLVS